MTSASTGMQHVIRDERATLLVQEALKNQYHRHGNSCVCSAAGDSEPALGISSGHGFFGLQCSMQRPQSDTSSFSGARATRDKIFVLLPQKVCCVCFLDSSESKESTTATKSEVTDNGIQQYFVVKATIPYVHQVPGRSQSADYPRCRNGMPQCLDTETVAHKKELPKTLQTGTTPEATPLDAQKKPTQKLSRGLRKDQEPSTFESGHPLPTDENTGRAKQHSFFFESAFLKKLQAPTAKVVSEFIPAESSTTLYIPVADKAAIRMTQAADYMWIHISCSDMPCTLPRLHRVSWDLPDLPDCRNVSCQTEPAELFNPKQMQRMQQAFQSTPVLLSKQPLSCDPNVSQFHSPGSYHKFNVPQSHAVSLPLECQKGNGLPRQSIQHQNRSSRQQKRIHDTRRSSNGGCQAHCAAKNSSEQQNKVSRSFQSLTYNESQDEPVRIREATLAEEVVSSQTAETWEPVIYSRMNAISCTNESDSAPVEENRSAYPTVHHRSRLPETFFGESPIYNSSLPTCSSEASSCSCGDSWQQMMPRAEPAGINRQQRPPKHNWRQQRRRRNGCDSQGVGNFKNTNNSLKFQGPKCSSNTGSPADFVSMNPMLSVAGIINNANGDLNSLFLKLDRAEQQPTCSTRAMKNRNPTSISRKSDVTHVPQPARGAFLSRLFDTCSVSGPAYSNADDGNDQHTDLLVNVYSEYSEVGNCLAYDMSIANQQCGSDNCYRYSNGQYRAAVDSRSVRPTEPSMEQPVGDSLASRSFSQNRQQRRNRWTETELLDSVEDTLVGLSRKLQNCLCRVHSAAAEIQERNAGLS